MGLFVKPPMRNQDGPAHLPPNLSRVLVAKDAYGYDPKRAIFSPSLHWQESGSPARCIRELRRLSRYSSMVFERSSDDHTCIF